MPGQDAGSAGRRCCTGTAGWARRSHAPTGITAVAKRTVNASTSMARGSPVKETPVGNAPQSFRRGPAGREPYLRHLSAARFHGRSTADDLAPGPERLGVAGSVCPRLGGPIPSPRYG
jgi:hypothetical protein